MIMEKLSVVSFFIEENRSSLAIGSNNYKFLRLEQCNVFIIFITYFW